MSLFAHFLLVFSCVFVWVSESRGCACLSTVSEPGLTLRAICSTSRCLTPNSVRARRLQGHINDNYEAFRILVNIPRKSISEAELCIARLLNVSHESKKSEKRGPRQKNLKNGTLFQILSHAAEDESSRCALENITIFFTLISLKHGGSSYTKMSRTGRKEGGRKREGD